MAKALEIKVSGVDEAIRMLVQQRSSANAEYTPPFDLTGV